MKTKLYFAFIALAFTIQVNAQDYFYANGDFETWKDTLGYSEPKGWSTLNALSLFSLPESTIQGDAHSGGFGAKLVTQANSVQDFPAVLSSAYILNSQGEPDLNLAKVPFTMRPKNFSMYYMAMPGAGDSCSGIMVLTRWNMAEQRADTIAFGGFFIKDSVTTYTKMVVPFNYSSPLAPDSALILIASSANAFAPVPGSTLYVDDFELGFETGLNEKENNLNNVSVYPNPANDMLTVKTEEKAFTVSMFDLQGRNIYTAASGRSQCEIHTSDLQAGIYMLEIRSERGAAHQKVVIAK
jgi:hypothetical protein